MSQENYRGDTLQKIAGIGFILGGILAVVFNAIFPRADDPSVVTQALASYADNETLSQLSYLGVAIGVMFVMIGTAGVYRKISTGGAAAWARLGFYGVIVATTLFFISSAVGLAMVGPALDWVAAGSAIDTSAYSIAAALLVASTSLWLSSCSGWLSASWPSVWSRAVPTRSGWAGCFSSLAS